ncbi:MAG: DUF1269 domain-containing protein, partial [Chloroflexales bacterium]|nr:DUF1269 domain-containing protein [Chloroflexales bacterium]
MAEKTPTQLVVASFASEDGADSAVEAVKQVLKEKHVKVREAAVIRNDANGKLHIRERGDLRAGGGAASGAAIGAAVGLFGGPLGALVGGATGAAIGGLTAKLRDTGVPEERIKAIGAALAPGTSALVGMVEESLVGEVEAALKAAGGTTLSAAVSETVASDLAAGKDVAYDALPAAGRSEEHT